MHLHKLLRSHERDAAASAQRTRPNDLTNHPAVMYFVQLGAVSLSALIEAVLGSEVWCGFEAVTRRRFCEHSRKT